MDNTWIEIDLNALKHNIKEIRKRIGRETSICGVVKDNAYGHGILQVSKTLIQEGVEYLGVADVSDGVFLKKNRIKVPVLNLVSNLKEEIKDIVNHDITQCVSDESQLNLLDAESKSNGKISKVHVELDTGIGRLGVLPENFKSLCDRIIKLKNVKLDGVFTHLSKSDIDRGYTLKQIKLFNI